MEGRDGRREVSYNHNTHNGRLNVSNIAKCKEKTEFNVIRRRA